jgi:hypothetical protein
MKNTNLIVMGVASVAFVVANQIAVNMEVIDPVMYFIGLLGGGGSLVLSIGGLIAEKAEQRLSEIEQEESEENSYTPKL